jgi:hypothetical protein
MTKQADFKRRVRARAAKTGESYAAARIHLLAARPDALHVTNGDSTVPTLRETGLAQRILVWRDVLHEGPVPNVSEVELRRVRGEFLDASFAERDRAFAANRQGEYVLWFEADLYDQLQLIQILARLHGFGVPPERITLICIGEHPGIAHFGGLGELTAAQLAGLPATVATTMTEAALDYATRAWAAFRAPDPMSLSTVTPLPELRFVAEAFDRLSREYPSRRDGLALSERRILAAVAEGAATAGEAFTRAWKREARPFLGDTWVYDRIARLVPLIDAPAPVDHHTPVRITEAGRRVLGGQDDHIARNGIDRWIGGVHLTGRTIPWRWDEGTESIVTV